MLTRVASAVLGHPRSSAGKAGRAALLLSLMGAVVGYRADPAHHVEPTAQDELSIVALSTRTDMVSGGDVLIRIEAEAGVSLREITVERNGLEVTSAFRPARDGHGLVGLVTGLIVGENRLVAHPRNRPAPLAVLVVTNHPISGPVLSGPHQQPFFCTTHLFHIVTGETLGPATGSDCSVSTRVDYVYRSTRGTIKPLPDLRSRPDDLAFTTTLDGHESPYIVRVETGTINRAIYELSMLHDPMRPAPDPWTSNPSWNGRLIYRFGGGCRRGWYTQGTRTGGTLDDVQLARGYAIASGSLNVFGNNCSDLLAAETMMMVKERFIEAYGPPVYTIGWGSSGDCITDGFSRGRGRRSIGGAGDHQSGGREVEAGLASRHTVSAKDVGHHRGIILLAKRPGCVRWHPRLREIQQLRHGPAAPGKLEARPRKLRRLEGTLHAREVALGTGLPIDLRSRRCLGSQVAGLRKLLCGTRAHRKDEQRQNGPESENAGRGNPCPSTSLFLPRLLPGRAPMLERAAV